MATIGQALTSPEPGWSRYDLSPSGRLHSSIASEGTWDINSVSGTYGGSVASSSNGKITFTFSGTKLRLIGTKQWNGGHGIIRVDGKETMFNCNTNPAIMQCLIYEKTKLENKLHTVVIETYDRQNIMVDAIDIDNTGRLLHPQEKTSLDDITTFGDYIRCNYKASRGHVGMFNSLGEEAGAMIPKTEPFPNSPDGDFYLFYVKDNYQGDKIFVADRHIQYEIPWDALNNAGIATATGLSIELDKKYKINVRLLTGGINISGVNGTTKYNEWDEIITNSTLGGTITPGNVDVWNWKGGWTWTSTSYGTNGSHRLVRGNTKVDAYTYYSSDYTLSKVGFRPVFVVEQKNKDTDPSIEISASLKGLNLQATIHGTTPGKVQYRVLLNESQKYPEEGFTKLADIPVNIDLSFTSDNIIIDPSAISPNNTVVIECKDEQGKIFNWSQSFVGEYVGIMFTDEDGNYYSTDTGNVLKKLPFEYVIAGTCSEVKKVFIKNKNSFTVSNIRLMVDRASLPPLAQVELSSTQNPFVPTDKLTLARTLAFDEQVEFYVRLNIGREAKPSGGEFNIHVKADPV